MISVRRPTAAQLTAQLMLGLALLGGAGVRLHLALTDDGIYWPDEIFQSLEPAHRLVFGYGLVPWEFATGARSWAFPGLVAGLLALCRAVGLTHPRAYLHVVRGLFALLGAGTAWAVARLAMRMGADALAAAAAAAAWAGGALFLYFAPRAMTECLSALLVPLGLADALPRNATPGQQRRGAVWLGLSVFLRLHNALFCAALLGTLALRRAGRSTLRVAWVLGLAALLLGLLDRLTWGHWFQSSLEYLRFNLVEGKSTQWGTAGPAYYAQVLFHAMPALSVALGALALLGARRTPALLLAFLLFALAHTGVGHKEARFLLPALPLLCAAAGLGLATLPAKQFLAAGLSVLGLLSALRSPTLTFGELGQYGGAKDALSAYDDFGSVNRLLQKAYDAEPRCGLKVEAVHLAWTGGYSHFHRPVPLYGNNGPPRSSGRYDWVITPQPWARGLPVLATDGAFALAHLSSTPCFPDPAFSWNLP